MKRYLGSLIDKSSLSLYIIWPLVCLFGAYLFYILPKESADDKIIFGGLIVLYLFTAVFMIYNLYSRKKQLLSTATFNEDELIVYTLFKEVYRIRYEKLVDVGVACYWQGKGFGYGFRYNYIYLSTYQRLNERQKLNINFIEQSDSFVKLGLSKKTYKKLLEILPSKQANMLERGYKEHIERLKRLKDGTISPKILGKK